MRIVAVLGAVVVAGIAALVYTSTSDPPVDQHSAISRQVGARDELARRESPRQPVRSRRPLADPPRADREGTEVIRSSARSSAEPQSATALENLSWLALGLPAPTDSSGFPQEDTGIVITPVEPGATRASGLGDNSEKEQADSPEREAEPPETEVEAKAAPEQKVEPAPNLEKWPRNPPPAEPRRMPPRQVDTGVLVTPVEASEEKKTQGEASEAKK
jgi:hypothetical protein